MNESYGVKSLRNQFGKEIKKKVKEKLPISLPLNQTSFFTLRLLTNIFYLSLPFILSFLQALFTFNSLNQIRYEELAESVRNVFWLQNRTIYDGVSSNVGWYGTLLLLYKIFGFHLFLGKVFRLLLHFASLFCLALLLKKYMGAKKALVPLLTIGLSPTLLYFNIIQTSFGLDLQYIPIALYLSASIDFKKNWKNVTKCILLGVITMVAWMSYPTFFFYLPALAILFLIRLKSRESSDGIWNTLIVGVAFLLPLIIMLLWLKNPSSLLYDPVSKRGLFRGSGSLQFDPQLFIAGVTGSLRDLFEKGSSYYFEIQNVEFSHIFPLFSVVIILIATFYLLLKRSGSLRSLQLIIGLTIFTIFSNLILANFTFDSSYMPGIRRNTPLLAGFYVFFTIVWYYITQKKLKDDSVRWFLIISLLIIPLHHILVIPSNLESLTKLSQFRDTQWFATQKDPQSSLKVMIERATKQNLQLACVGPSGEFVLCRLSEAFAAVSGSCLWNRLECKQILGYDDKTKQFIPLSTDLWESYYFQH